MTDQIFTARTYQTNFMLKIMGVLLIMVSIIILFIPVHWIPRCLFFVLYAVLGSILLIMPPVKICIDDIGIKMQRKCESGQLQLCKRFKPDPETGCEWGWIHAVSTRRGVDHTYRTCISIKRDGFIKPLPPIKMDSLLLKDEDYARILNTIQAMAPQATFDRTSELIMTGQIRSFPTVRPLFCFMLISVLMAVIFALMKDGFFVDPLEFFGPSGGKKL